MLDQLFLVLELWVVFLVLALDLHVTVEINLVCDLMMHLFLVRVITEMKISEVGFLGLLVKGLDIDVSVDMTFTESTCTMVFSVSAIQGVSFSMFVNHWHLFADAELPGSRMFPLNSGWSYD